MGKWPLEPGRDEFVAMAHEVVDRVAAFVEAIPDLPSHPTAAALGLARQVPAPTRRGGDLAALLDLVDAGAREAFNCAGPHYMAYIPGGGVITAALADLYADAINRYVGMAAPAPVLVAIEEAVLRWFASLFEFPSTSQGILTSGGSLANFSAVVTARVDRLGEDFLDGTIYVSEHVHGSVTKAARLAGFPVDAVRLVPCDDDLRMRPAAVLEAVVADRAAGRRPALLVGSAGTTNTGTIDPLPELADVAEEAGLWFHVDAAYGGFFALTDHGRARLTGIERADSITLDPHKGLFLPFGLGALLVRDGTALRRAHSDEAAYLADIQDVYAEAGLPNYSEHSPELTRDFRGLRAWLPLQLHGTDAFRTTLEEKLELARHVHATLRDDARFDVPWEPDLTVVPFRLRGADDDANRAFLDRINASQRVLLSGTTLHDEYWLRVAVLAHRTHRDRVDELLTIIDEAAA